MSRRRPLRRLRAAGLAAAVALALSGCAHGPRPEPPAPAGADVQALSGAPLIGRLVIRIEAAPDPSAVTPTADALPGAPRLLDADFELQGDAERGRLLLSTRLGNRLADAEWRQGRVMLRTADGQERQYASMPELAQSLLGEPLPLQAMAEWMRGRAWAGAQVQSTAEPGQFEQLGWAVDLRGLPDEGRVSADRREPAPAVRLRVRLENPPFR